MFPFLAQFYSKFSVKATKFDVVVVVVVFFLSVFFFFLLCLFFHAVLMVKVHEEVNQTCAMYVRQN